jgi:radical SAM superfamily enzyme YgiQ (UPF0313 family)
LLIGEAEDVWPEVLEDFQRDELNERYQPADWPDLAGRPAPRYDLVDKRNYQMEMVPIEAGRGCPNGCDYCAVTGFHGAQRRLRPVGEVVRNIRAAGSRFLAFVDDNIVAEPDYARELFEALAKLDVRWLAAGSMTLADQPTLLGAAVRAGLRFYWVGVESLDATTLADVHRPINQIGDFDRRLEALRKHGLLVGANFILGFDADTLDTYERVASFVAKTKVMPFLYVLTPMPGTKLFARLEAAGRIVNRDWSRYSGFETVYQPLRCTPEEQNERYFALASRLFSLGSNLRRAWSGLTLRNFPDGLFTHLGAFALAGRVGAAARKRQPGYW